MQWKTASLVSDYVRPLPARPYLSVDIRRLTACLAVAFLFGLGTLTGCSSNKKTAAVHTAVKGVEKSKLRIGWPAGVEPALLRDFANTWAANQGTQLEIVGVDPNGEPGTLSPVDLLVLAPAELPRWAAADKLLPLPDALVKDARFRDGAFLEVYRQLLTWKHQQYALPLVGEGLLCFYREDLLQAQGAAFHKRHGRPLKPPQTWEEVEDLARFFHELPAENGKRVPSLPPLPARDLDLEREFYAAAAPFVRRGVPEKPQPPVSTEARFSFHFSVTSGEVWIDTAGFVHALQLLQRLQDYRAAPPAAEAPTAFRNGNAVLCLAPLTPWINRFQATSSVVRDKFGIARVPGSTFVFDPHSGQRVPLREVNHVPYLGAAGWLGVVPKSAAHPDAAFALLAWLNEPGVSKDVATSPTYGGPFRKEHLLTTAVKWDGLGLGARTAEFVQVLKNSLEHDQVTNPVFRLRIPDEARFRQALAARLRPAIVEKQDAAKVLKEVAEDWRKLIQAKGQAEHRADYRRGMGLDP